MTPNRILLSVSSRPSGRWIALNLSIRSFLLVLAVVLLGGCENKPAMQEVTAAQILGSADYPALSFGGHRHKERKIAPTVEELKEDMRILNAMGVKLIRTYNTQLFEETGRLMQAIREVKAEDPNFEMYVMMGIWIDCAGAWTANPDHSVEDPKNNNAEFDTAVKFAKENPDIVKVMAVGNEAMVHWAATYFVGPDVILKYVNKLQEMKANGELSKDLWITSSDNFASWGGEGAYHNDKLVELISAVDFLSVNTYPFHDTHYHNAFWVREANAAQSKEERLTEAMDLALEHAQEQVGAVKAYLQTLGIDKPIHIGETGWSSMDGHFYGDSGTHAADEYKQKLYFDRMRAWTEAEGMSCFFFEAFDEPWKDNKDENGSENHFGLISITGEAKYAIWDLVDQGAFEGLTRNGHTITKSHQGNESSLMELVLLPPVKESGSQPQTAEL